MEDKEVKKTVIFLLVAGMALLVAWEPWRPSSTAGSLPAEKVVGTKVFPEFKDPLAAKSLEITRFDESNATIHPFKVAQVNGVWSIPSHSNYPADAREHMAQAATALLDLEVLGLASDSRGDQELYGVIAPDPNKIKPGVVGVGTQITIKDDGGKALADLVIGKEVKDQPNLRYVRRADQDQIFRVSLKTDKLSTKFEDWIEKDLLKLNAFDVRQVELNDYSTQTGVDAQGRRGLALEMRSREKLTYDDAQNKWNLVEMATFDKQGQPIPVELKEDEELNIEKLNDLKSALDDLQIVDVERKPGGLSRDLRASEEFVKNMEAVQSLDERGFSPAQRPGGQVEIYSSEGEVDCTTKEGVRYVMRFGGLAGGADVKDNFSTEGEKKNSALNRYLFLTAQFDETQIPKPEFLPETPPGDEARPATTDSKPAEDPADKPGDNPSTDEIPEIKTADGEANSQDPPAQAESATPPATPEKAADAKADPPVEAQPTTPEEVQRMAVQRENKRRQQEYDDAIKKGQDKVKEMNDRFADWYFIISDDVYKKVHLGRADIVRTKAAKDAEDAGLPANPLDALHNHIHDPQE